MTIVDLKNGKIKFFLKEDKEKKLFMKKKNK